MNGILLLNKPKGISSFKAIRNVQKKLNISKIGHCGTLDPLATGMLPIVTNEGTKYSQYILSSDKAYTVTMQLGLSSNTYDCEGDITSTKNVTDEMLASLPGVVQTFIGAQQQMPPKFSALKINGQRAYDLARKGVEFALKPRSITIHEIKIIKQDNTFLTMYVECAKGTYIRSLVNDIGNALGCGAIMTELHRNWVSPFNHQTMYDIHAIESNNLIPIETLFEQTICLNLKDTIDIQHGKAIKILDVESIDTTQPIALFTLKHMFLGIGMLKEDYIYPKRLLTKQSD